MRSWGGGRHLEAPGCGVECHQARCLVIRRQLNIKLFSIAVNKRSLLARPVKFLVLAPAPLLRAFFVAELRSVVVGDRLGFVVVIINKS